MDKQAIFDFLIEHLTLRVGQQSYPQSERIDIELVLKHPSTGEDCHLGGGFFLIPNEPRSRYE